jgi:hypothetical protein
LRLIAYVDRLCAENYHISPSVLAKSDRLLGRAQLRWRIAQACQSACQVLASRSRKLTIPITTTPGSGSVQRVLSAAIAAAAGFNVCEAADKRYSLGASNMTGGKKISGWHRLWIVLSAIYLVLVVFISALQFPQTETPFSQEERLKRSSTLVAEYLRTNPEFAKHPPVLPSEYGGVPVDHSQIAVDLSRLHSKYKGRVDFSTVEQAFSPDLKSKRLQYVGVVFLIWFVPVVVIYLLGLAAGWVIRGFAQK